MTRRNNKNRPKQPPKATLDLKAKDITDKGKTPARAKTGSSASVPASKTGTPSSSSIPKTGTAPVSSRDSAKTASSGPATARATSKTADTPSAASVPGIKSTGNNGKTGTRPAAAKNSTATKTGTVAKQKSGGSLFSNIISAVVGGIVALLGMSYAGGPGKVMNMAGIPVSANNSNPGIESLRRDIDALKKGSSGTGLAALQQRIAALETGQGSSGNRSADNTRLATLEASMSDLAKAARSGGGAAVASAALVKKQMDDAGVHKFRNQITGLRKQNTKVFEEQAKLHEGMTAIQEEQAKIHSSFAKLREDTARLRNSSARMSSEIAKGPDLTRAMAPLLEKISDFEKQISAVQSENRQAKSEGRNIALAIELSNLKRAVSRGISYDQELQRIRPHVPTGMDISLLEKYASGGLPNIAMLGKSLNSYMDDILESESVPETGSWQDKLLARAKSVVKLRPAGNGTARGNDTPAILSRIEYRLGKKQDLAGALTEAKAFKQKPAKAAQGWILLASDKLAGDRLLNQIEEKLIGSLGRSGSN